MYLLTPIGVLVKVELTVRFLKYKMDEFERIQDEINSLRQDLKTSVVMNTANGWKSL